MLRKLFQGESARRLSVWICALLFASCSELGQSQQYLIESEVLKLEISTTPYSFRLIEKATSQVLLKHAQTAIRSARLLGLYTDWTPVGQAELRQKSPTEISLALLTSSKSAVGEVVLSLVGSEGLRVSVRSTGTEADGISQTFVDQGEHYYGVWEYPYGGKLDNRGVDQPFIGTGEQPGTNYANARAPFYITNRKYGVYAETSAYGHYSFAINGQTNFWFTGSKLDYHVLYGPSFAKVLERYNALAGPARMPPTWALGTLWWRDNAHRGKPEMINAQARVLRDAEQLQAYRIPATAMWIDRPYGTGSMGWGNMDFAHSFPDPASLVTDLEKRGIKLLVWIANRAANRLKADGLAKGYLFAGYTDWPAADLRNPGAYAWFKDELDKLVRFGIRGYKIDRGAENEMPDWVQNQNVNLFAELAAQGLKERYGDDFFIFARNINDVARHYAAHWNGDTESSFRGLRMSVKNALRSGVINFPMWGSDVGGYLGRPDKELFARWLAFGAYSTMMEVLIGATDEGSRTIWTGYDAELIEIARQYTATHHDLMPYVRSALYQATLTGMPVMRPLIFVYPDDPTLVDVWDEYLFGENLLVAPIVAHGARKREVYLPPGRWLDYNYKNKSHQGPKLVEVDAPLGMIPLFVKAGAIVPRGELIRGNNNWTADWSPRLRIELFPDEAVESQFHYYTGRFVRKVLIKRATQSSLIVYIDDLGLPGVLEVYLRGITGVKKNEQKLVEGKGYKYSQKQRQLVVPFHGRTTIELVGARSLFSDQ